MDTVDSTKHQTFAIRLSGIAVLMLACVLVGCPRKITEKIPVPCDQAGAGPAPSVHELVTVAVLGSGNEHRAIVATSTYAQVVRLNAKVGTEGAVVTRLGANNVTATLPTGQKVVIPNQRSTATKDQPRNTASAGSSASSGAIDPNALTQWRISVMNAVKQGAGVPHDMMMALSFALSDPSRSNVASALKGLGWGAAPELAKIYLSRLNLDKGRVRIEGVAPNEAASRALVRRLRKASPYIRQVSGGSGRLVTEGFQFSISFVAAMVTANDVAQPGSGGNQPPVPLSGEARKKLENASRDIPKVAQVAQVEQLIRLAADRVGGLQISQLSNRAQKTEEGSLGRATINFTATGSMKSVQPFLKALQKGSSASLPVVLDPLTIEASVLRASVHIVYAAGGSDTRSPTPSAIQAPPSDMPQWRRVRNLPADNTRNPFAPQ